MRFPAFGGGQGAGGRQRLCKPASSLFGPASIGALAPVPPCSGPAGVAPFGHLAAKLRNKVAGSLSPATRLQNRAFIRDWLPLR